MALGTEESLENPLGYCHACSRLVQTRVNPTSQEAECMECESSFVERLEDGAELDEFLGEREEGSPPPRTPRTRGNTTIGIRRGMIRSSAVTNRRSSGVGSLSTGELVATAIRHIISQAHRDHRDTEASTVLAGGDGVELLGALAPLLAASSSGRSEALGDYAVGSLSNIIEQLVANDPTGGRVPSPASKRAIDQLCKTIEIQQKHIDDGWECGIFKEPFGIGEKAMTLPCGHVFLDDAIHRWFKDHHSCPVCRHALPTEADDRRSASQETTVTSATETPSIEDSVSTQESSG